MFGTTSFGFDLKILGGNENPQPNAKTDKMF